MYVYVYIYIYIHIYIYIYIHTYAHSTTTTTAATTTTTTKVLRVQLLRRRLPPEPRRVQDRGGAGSKGRVLEETRMI